VDHFHKSSDKTFSIPLIRMLAFNASTGGNKSILLNPGGPGGKFISLTKMLESNQAQVVG
jgi:hypothetical protein